MARAKRVYRKGAKNSEYDSYHGKPEQIKRRAQRNKARREAGCKKGQEAHHVTGKRKGSLTGKVKCISAKKNKSMQPKRGKKKKK
jgi:cytidylate kinase